MILLQILLLTPFLVATKVTSFKHHQVISPRSEIYLLEGNATKLSFSIEDQISSVVIVISHGKSSQTYITVPESIIIEAGDYAYILSPKRREDAKRMRQFYMRHPPSKESFSVCPLAEYKELQFLSDDQRYRITCQIFIRVLAAFVIMLI